MEIKDIQFSTDSENRQKVIFEFNDEHTKVNYGTVFLKKGIRIPGQGFTTHEQHEISFVQSGKIQMLNEDGTELGILKTGDVIHLDPLEPQAGFVLEDTRIIYVLIG